MTIPGKSAWTPAWNGAKGSGLLPANACPKCRGTLERLCSTVACDTCDYVAPRLGQRGAPRPPEPPATTPKLNRFGSADERQAKALAWLRAHPWSSALEGAQALSLRTDAVRSYWLRGGATRRFRGSAQTHEYILEGQEAVAC
jgi:hypothetical protein